MIDGGSMLGDFEMPFFGNKSFAKFPKGAFQTLPYMFVNRKSQFNQNMELKIEQPYLRKKRAR